MKLVNCLLGIYLLTISLCWGQSSPLFIPPPGISLDKGWTWHAGDNPNWAKPGFDDSNWERIDPTKDIMDIPQLWKTDIGWFRLRFTMDSLLVGKSLAIMVQQTGASEIYLNGRLVKKFGKISNETRQVQAATPVNGTFIGVPIRKAGEQVVAVRFAIQKGIPYIEMVGQKNVAQSLLLIETEAINFYLENDIRVPFDYFKFGLFLLLTVIHLALFSFNTSQKSNFYFFLFALSSSINSLLLGLVYYHVHYAATKMAFLIAISLLYIISCIFFLTAIYSIFKHRRGIVYWVLIAYSFASLALPFIFYHNGYNFGITLLPFLAFIEAIRITFLSAQKRQRGAFIVVGGAVLFYLFYTLWFVILFKYLPAGPAWLYGHLAFNIGYISLPVSISIYLALEASFTSRSLTEKLQEVEMLSDEKQHILATQNETLEKQVTERTAELNQSLIDLKSTQTQLIQKEKMASLGELTAGIAHEIQNPLNFVNNFSEVSTELVGELREEEAKAVRDPEVIGELLDDLTQNLEKITQHGQRASSIVKGMLEHSRTSTGERQPTDLNALAEEYLCLAYQGVRAKNKEFNCELVTHFDTDLGLVEIGPQEIGRVLLNLFNNAFYAVSEKKKHQPTGYGPTVSISTRRLPNQIEIRVKDNGSGIPELIKAKIFQPFFTTKPTGQGTGLGLSLSYDIVTKGHSGILALQSVEGKETEFIVSLPA